MASNPIIIKKPMNRGGSGRGPRVAIPGVFPSSSQFGEQVVKFRVPSLDAFIGGGVPIGSICVIVDEFPSQFGDMVLKSFLADGATYNHRLFIASRYVDPENLSKDLPSLRKNSSANDSSKNLEDDPSTALKIAWRYGQEHQPGVPPRAGKNAELNSLSFDFSKKASVSDLGGKHLFLSKCYNDMNFKCSNDDLGEQLLTEIMQAVDGLDFETSKSVNNVTRICISHCEELIGSKQFLMRLRSIVRHTNSCAVITVSDAASIPLKTLNRLSYMTKIEHLADIVISLQSIVDQKRRDELGGIDGVCNIKKVSSSNSLKIFESPKDIGVSFMKKRLLFHELHLPPEGETTTQREASSSSAIKSSASLVPPSTGCSSTSFVNKGKSIDF